MCGLWAYLLRAGRLFDSTDYVRHDPWKHANASRGPDRTTEVQGADYHFCFHRLAIHDLSPNGDQPFYFEWKKNGVILHLMCNGEIYNYEHIVGKFKLKKKLQSSSDCEVLCHLLEHFDGDVSRVVKELDGEYAFVARMEDENGRVRIVAARDPFGVRPLYYSSTPKGIVFSSMLSGIVGLEDGASADHFPPGHTYSEWISDMLDTNKLEAFYDLDKVQTANVGHDMTDIYRNITDAFILAVKKRLTSDRQIGFLLSGGLDSSLVVAVATKILGVKKPKTFTIAIDENATDLSYAREVAEHVGSHHTEVRIRQEDAIEVMPEVIQAIETYDITTIRASTPQYLLARYISANTQVRVILNGDGSDEVACGYLYHHACPTDEEAHADTLRLLQEIHRYDGLRVDRTLAAHGLEARLPFLDPEFVRTYLSVPIGYRRANKKNGRMEKQLLRDAFASLYPDILPTNVLYRMKEALSDGVSSTEKSWYQMIQTHLGVRKNKNIQTEPEWYKQVFDNYFPSHGHVIAQYWMPRWIVGATDPSARTLNDIYTT